MSGLCPDLREVARAAAVVGPGEFIVAGARFRAPPASLRARVAEVLYERIYCRPCRGGRAGVPPVTPRAFVASLSAANLGRGTFEAGWRLERIDEDGRLVVERDDLRIWALPHQFRAERGSATGATGRLWVDKERRAAVPGYYLAFGDVDAREGPRLRLYFHLRAAGAAPFVRALTASFNRARVPFYAKLLSDPTDYRRADAAVVYLARREAPSVAAALDEVRVAVVRWLRPAVPLCTYRLAAGVALAEDPPDGASFGESRSRLIARALAEAFECGANTCRRRVEAVRASFVREGLDPRKPWRGADAEEIGLEGRGVRRARRR